jgi:hypothetical protein
MKKEALKRIFDFLEEKGEQRIPFLWKWKNEIPLTEEDLNVQGDLDFSQSEIKSLPEGLKISGDLDLSYTYIRLLPKGLKVGGHLDLTESDIEFLPKGLEVGGDLILDGCADIKTLPKGLKVGGNLELIGITLGEDYDDDELRKMIKPGFIKGRINAE